MSSTAANSVAVMTAAIKASSDPQLQTVRRTVKAGYTPRGPNSSTFSSIPNSLPNSGQYLGPATFGNAQAKTNQSAVADGPPLASLPEDEKGSNKARVRRASEGSHLRKEGKRVGAGELRCDKCGKGYKHSSCLTKHLLVFPQYCYFFQPSACSASRVHDFAAVLFCVWLAAWKRVFELTYITDGSIRLNGSSLLNCSSQSISKYNCWKLRPFLLR
jgi:hypothetical protein